MPQSKTEIRNRALKRLGVTGWGETSQTAITDDMDDAYDEVYAQLEDAELVTWASTADVPDKMVMPVVDLCALARVMEHPVSDSRYQKLILSAGKDGELAIGKIRARKNEPFQSTEEAVYY